MRFSEFLKTTVLLSAGTASLLAVITVLGATRDLDPTLVYVSAIWWVAAAVIGGRLGRGESVSPSIRRLLADARTQTTLPELRPGTTLVNRLWPLLFMTIVAGIAGIFLPQPASVATGFAIIWSLAWRRQHLAVMAIELRDSARFYVDKTSPLQPIRLIRTPGWGGD